MKRVKSNVTLRHAIAAFAAASALLGSIFGCATLGLPSDRLQLCHSNEDCKKRDAKTPACANTRCVECAYDSDCGESGLCSDNHCKTFFKSEGDTGPEGPPANLDACLSRCNDDQGCVNKCHDQFHSSDTSTAPPQ